MSSRKVSKRTDMRNFRLLKPEEIEVRVQNVKENGLVALLYKTARTDYQLLDEQIGMYRWQNKYEVIDGKMYCGIGIQDNDGTWVWKWNCGTESETEAEKGQASDSMKRAGFCWGIGTELYSSPFIWIPADKCNIDSRNGKLRCYDSFKVSDIEYDDKENISALVIENTKTLETVFVYGKPNYTTTTVKAPRRANTAENQEIGDDGSFTPVCKDCGKKITVKVHDFSVKKYGAPYCMDCQKNHAN